MNRSRIFAVALLALAILAGPLAAACTDCCGGAAPLSVAPPSCCDCGARLQRAPDPVRFAAPEPAFQALLAESLPGVAAGSGAPPVANRFQPVAATLSCFPTRATAPLRL